MEIYLVGGAVRDKLLGLPVTERDWVVVGAQTKELLALGYRKVGKDFPVFLHPKSHEEYALARTERKTAPGYHGFEFETAEVSLEDDLKRRDLTINAIAQDHNGLIIDPYAGQHDLKNHILRHISPAFSEDPVRVLRVARLAAQLGKFNFTVAAETQKLMQQMVEQGEVDALVPERVWQELHKALNTGHASLFFSLLNNCGALQRLFPEWSKTLFQLHVYPQNPASNINLIALDVSRNKKLSVQISFALLCHNLSALQIQQLCSDYRIPNDFRELAVQLSQNYQTLLNPAPLDALTLLKLLTTTDAFRRPERFSALLESVKVMAEVLQLDHNKHHDLFTQSLQTCSMINVRQLDPEKKMNGQQIAATLKQARLSALKNLLRIN